jgi:hypothetical protein
MQCGIFVCQRPPMAASWVSTCKGAPSTAGPSSSARWSPTPSRVISGCKCTMKFWPAGALTSGYYIISSNTPLMNTIESGWRWQAHLPRASHQSHPGLSRTGACGAMYVLGITACAYSNIVSQPVSFSASLTAQINGVSEAFGDRLFRDRCARSGPLHNGLSINGTR